MNGYKTLGMAVLVSAALAASSKASEMDRLKAMEQSPEAAAQGFTGANSGTAVVASNDPAMKVLAAAPIPADQTENSAWANTSENAAGRAPLLVAGNDGPSTSAPYGGDWDSYLPHGPSEPSNWKKFLGCAAGVGAGILGGIAGLVIGPVMAVAQGWTFWQGLASPIVGMVVEGNTQAISAYDSVTGDDMYSSLTWPNSDPDAQKNNI